MMYYLDPDFQRRLEEFNLSRGGPAYIAVAWDVNKARWRIWAIPVNDSRHPLARNGITSKMSRPLPDGSGRWGVPLNLWQGLNGEFEPMDERLFEAIVYADSFRSRKHFEETIEQADIQRELAQSKKLRDISYAARSYWWGLDRVVKNMNPNVSSPGDWRATRSWR